MCKNCSSQIKTLWFAYAVLFLSYTFSWVYDLKLLQHRYSQLDRKVIYYRSQIIHKNKRNEDILKGFLAHKHRYSTGEIYIERKEKEKELPSLWKKFR